MFAMALCPSIAWAQKAERDTTNMGPWDQDRSASESTSGTFSIYSEDLEKTPSLDLRAMITGKIPGLEVIEHGQDLFRSSNMNNPWLSNGSLTFASKAFSSIACIVDDIPVPFSQFLLDPNQIESVSLVSNVLDKASVNPYASTGALYIRTKKGQYDTPLRVVVQAETGVGFVDNFPEWVGGVAYARLNNRAREASGYPQRYSDAAISGFAQNDPMSRRYPNVDYKSLILRNWKPQSRVGVNLYGGGRMVKYNASLNGINDGDLYKVGPVADCDKLNLTTSVTAKINRYIEANVNFMGMLQYRRGNNAGLFAYRDTPPVAFPLALGLSSGDTGLDSDQKGMPIYAVSRQYTSNPYAQTVDGGFYFTRIRSGNFNARLSVDFSWLIPGLKSMTMVNFGSSYYLRNGKKDDYLAYYWDADDDIVDLSSHLGVKASSKSQLGQSTYQTTNFFERLTYDWAKAGNSLNAALTYYQSSSSQAGRNTYDRVQFGTATVHFNHKNRYIADVAAQYAGATRYAPKKRYALFPTVGFAWVASNESWLKKSEAVDFLKFYTQFGQVGSSDFIGDNYLYDGDYSLPGSMNFGPATAYQWFGTDKQEPKYSEVNRLSNPNLTWPKLTQLDFGAQVSFLGMFDVSLGGFFMNRTGIIADVMGAFIDTYGWSGMACYQNYTSKRSVGYEVSLGFHRKFGDVGVKLNVWGTGWKTINTKVVDDTYLYDWQKKTGAGESSIWGYVCLGKFTSQEQIDSKPLYDANTKVGDLMYEDLNGDGKIDSNDRRVIGDSSPRLRYSVNLNLTYKNLELDIVGNGRAFYDIQMTNSYFWNGWGDGNYSKFVMENIGGDYPNLTFDKSSNNFVVSDFWLRKGGFFKIQSAELAYNFKARRPEKSVVKAIRISVKGGNFATFTNVKYVDPEDIDAGVSLYPYLKTISAGVKVTF